MLLMVPFCKAIYILVALLGKEGKSVKVSEFFLYHETGEKYNNNCFAVQIISQGSLQGIKVETFTRSTCVEGTPGGLN